MSDSSAGIRVMPGTVPRNGLPVGGGYVYRGTGFDVLTPGTGSGPRPRRKPVPVPEPVTAAVVDGARLAELEAELAARGVVDAGGGS